MFSLRPLLLETSWEQETTKYQLNYLDILGWPTRLVRAMQVWSIHGWWGRSMTPTCYGPLMKPLIYCYDYLIVWWNFILPIFCQTHAMRMNFMFFTHQFQRSDRERGLFERACRSGASFPCPISWVMVPMKENPDSETFEMIQWTILCPYQFVSVVIP